MPNYHQSELIERVDFTKDLALFKFRPDGPFEFIPGQYATIGIEDGNKMIRRPYSIASSPHEPFLEFYIELVPHGQLTPRLWELNIGEKVLIRDKIVGHFTLDEKRGVKRHLMLSTVTGAAPFVSMIRTQQIELKRGKPNHNQMLLIHGGSHSEELGVYKDELNAAARDGWLVYVPTVSRPWHDLDWRGETGRTEDLIRKYADRLVFDAHNTMAYACGHPNMIEHAKGVLTRMNFHKDHIKEEKYFSITR